VVGQDGSEARDATPLSEEDALTIALRDQMLEEIWRDTVRRFVHHDGDEWRPCPLFPNQVVAAAGWCNAWAPKP